MALCQISSSPYHGNDQAVGRDRATPSRQYRYSWLDPHLPPDTLLHTSLYTRSSSDHVLPTTDPITPLSDAPVLASRWASRVTSRTPGPVTFSRRESTSSNSVRAKAFSSTRVATPDTFPAFQGWGKGGQASFYYKIIFLRYTI